MTLSRFNHNLLFFLSVLHLDSFRELGISWVGTDEVRTGHWCVVFQDSRIKEQVAAQQTQCSTFPLTSLATFSTGNREADTYHTGRERALEREDDLNRDFVSCGRKFGKGKKRPPYFLVDAATSNYTLHHS